MPAEHHFPVTRTARYHQQGELSASTRQLWLVCHGYGNLASYFVRHFAFLAENDPHTVVIAPEGLSRFYLQGTSGRVGASWMTSEDRLHEIDDQNRYLNDLTAWLLPQCAPDVQVSVLGFSQGTATASRWLVQAPFRPAQLILWAGNFPEDIPHEAATRLLTGLQLHLVVGDSDGYFSDEQVAQQEAQLRTLGGQPTTTRFEGHHELKWLVIRRLALPMPSGE